MTGVLLLAAASGALACASGQGGGAGNPFAAGTAGEQEIRIRVDNREFSDATVYALAPSGRRRLGRVVGKTEEAFTLRWTAPQPLRVRIELHAGPTCETREVQADPGDVLDLIIDSSLSQFRSCREE